MTVHGESRGAGERRPELFAWKCPECGDMHQRSLDRTDVFCLRHEHENERGRKYRPQMVRVTVVEEQAGAPEREARLALIAVAAIADGTLLGDEEACEEELDELFRRDVLITEQREPGLFVACLADAGREFIRAALATPARPEGPSTEAAVEAGITALVEGGWANREFHPLETRKAVRAVLMAASGGARPGVTDEAVEKGARALWAEGGGSGPWDKQTTNTQEYYRKLSRGFLEAVGQGPDEAER